MIFPEEKRRNSSIPRIAPRAAVQRSSMRAWSDVGIDGGCISRGRRADREPPSSSALHSIPACLFPHSVGISPKLNPENWPHLPDRK